MSNSSSNKAAVSDDLPGFSGSGEMQKTEFMSDQVVQQAGYDLEGFKRGVGMYEVLQDSVIPVPTLADKDLDNESIVLELVDGEMPSEPWQFELVGRTIARLHDEFAPISYGKLDPNDTDPERGGEYSDWSDYIGTSFSHFVKSVGSLYDIDLEMDVRNAFYDVEDSINDEFEPSILHGDLDQDEFAIEGEVKAVFDWDEAMAGDPCYEFVTFRDSLSDSANQDAFEQGYHQVRETDISDEKEKAYLLFDAVKTTAYFNWRESDGNLTEQERNSHRERLEDLI